MDKKQILEVANGKIKKQRRSAIRTYIVSVILEFLSSSAAVFAVVQLTDFNSDGIEWRI